MQAATQPKIRRAGPEDARAIAAVLLESFSEFRALYTDGGFAATALGERLMLGTGAAVAKSESVYIRGMAVLPKARGSGVGTRMLRQIEAWANGEGYTRLFLSTTPFLVSAIRLYEEFGFLRTDEGLHDLFGTPLFTMEKTVSRY